jgi:hypothetical protein
MPGSNAFAHFIAVPMLIIDAKQTALGMADRKLCDALINTQLGQSGSESSANVMRGGFAMVPSSEPHQAM